MSEHSSWQFAELILKDNRDISPLISEVQTHIEEFRALGLSDEVIEQVVPELFRVKFALHEYDDDEFGLEGEEIRVVEFPRKYQREDWS